MPVMNNTKALRHINTSIYMHIVCTFFKKLDAVSRSIVSHAVIFFCLVTNSLFPNEEGETQEWRHGIHVHVLQNCEQKSSRFLSKNKMAAPKAQKQNAIMLYPFERQYQHTNSPNWSLYISKENKLRDSDGLYGENWCLSLLGLKGLTHLLLEILPKNAFWS